MYVYIPYQCSSLYSVLARVQAQTCSVHSVIEGILRLCSITFSVYVASGCWTVNCLIKKRQNFAKKRELLNILTLCLGSGESEQEVHKVLFWYCPRSSAYPRTRNTLSPFDQLSVCPLILHKTYKLCN